MKVKEETEKAGLKLSIQKTDIMASGSITSWQTDGKEMETVTDFIFLASKIKVDDDCSHKLKDTCSKRYQKKKKTKKKKGKTRNERGGLIHL